MGNLQNMFGIHIPGVCGSTCPSSKQGDIDIARSEIPRKKKMNEHEANWCGSIWLNVQKGAKQVLNQHLWFWPNTPVLEITTLLVQPNRLDKNVGLKSSSSGQCVPRFFLSLKATILADWWPAITVWLPNLAASHPLTPLLQSTSFWAFFRHQYFWCNQTAWKQGCGSRIIFSTSMRVKMLFKPKSNHSRPPGADWCPAITQLGR